MKKKQAKQPNKLSQRAREIIARTRESRARIDEFIKDIECETTPATETATIPSQLPSATSANPSQPPTPSAKQRGKRVVQRAQTLSPMESVHAQRNRDT